MAPLLLRDSETGHELLEYLVGRLRNFAKVRNVDDARARVLALAQSSTPVLLLLLLQLEVKGAGFMICLKQQQQHRCQELT